MPATLDDLDAALVAALQPLLLTSPTPGPLRLVDRFVPDPQRTFGDHINAVVAAARPAALVWLEQGDAENAFESLAGVDEETVEHTSCSVLVVASDVRAPKDAVKGTPGAPGVYAIATAARDALNGLPIAGLWRSHRLRYRGWRWQYSELGRLYVLNLRFLAETVVGDAVVTDDTDALEEVGVNVNLQSTDADPPPAALGQTLIPTT